ncbi:hypothetical protein RRV45_01210 [Bacillus sp. DTU_2020_1000418_1_SI_GHA_SEK_038]|uniref:hypothetical protein n=1 Tax=Bacillus sp. DTU_2020_1000418_1_SI_GHA_SEK_038 TaxID=3077585 RepID=UPI0028ECD052|nr:hypothetical protein [Bacillus sp. DTU_2020_1000418_1_SI_GHA_SEK_038]WNS77690.1 hypothetical protein RRV45_01210 [Bacillus sp. DTU_2020_1000418_1_SI_GHA_SEK_038]
MGLLFIEVTEQLVADVYIFINCYKWTKREGAIILKYIFFMLLYLVAEYFSNEPMVKSMILMVFSLFLFFEAYKEFKDNNGYLKLSIFLFILGLISISYSIFNSLKYLF